VAYEDKEAHKNIEMPDEKEAHKDTETHDDKSSYQEITSEVLPDSPHMDMSNPAILIKDEEVYVSSPTNLKDEEVSVRSPTNLKEEENTLSKITVTESIVINNDSKNNIDIEKSQTSNIKLNGIIIH
jgi:hypothetical protein